MENASKALLIAGGILLSILIVSIMLYMYTSIRNVSETETEVLKAEKLSEFNMQFESYNLKSMYGTDIISVINQANAVNEKYEKIIVTIELSINDTFYDITIQNKLNVSTGKYEKYGEGKIERLEGGRTYTNNSEELKQLIINNSQKRTEYSDDRKEVKEIIPAISEFKSRKFKCTKMEYDSSSGRVKLMTFEQL